MRSLHAGRILAVWAATVALGAAPARLAAQRPPKPAASDTLKRRPTTDTTRKRIKVVKEPTVRQAGGEVALPLITQATLDSALTAERVGVAEREQYARETQRLLDSIETAGIVRRAVAQVRQESFAERERERADSIANAQRVAEDNVIALRRRLARGWYAGLGAGASTPQVDLRHGYTGGWNVTAPIGYDQTDSPLGFRADFSVDRLSATRISDVVATDVAADVTIWSLNTDVKLRTHAPGTPNRSNIYLLGGLGAHRVAAGVYGVTGPKAGSQLTFGNASTKLGWNAGAGLALEWGPAEVFVETRFVQVKTDMSYGPNGGIGRYTAFVPIVVGVQWF